MNKISVVQTVAFAYNFLVTRFGTVIGITALPALLASAVDYLVRSYITAEETQAAAGTNLLISTAGLATTIFIWAVASVGITRAALGLPLGSGAYYFPVSMLELRMFGAMLRFWFGVVVLLALASLVSSVAAVVGGVPLDGSSPPESSAAGMVVGIATLAAFGYAILTIFRMGFLLSATVVSEAKSGLQRSHDLARGNFWRIAAVLLALVAPIVFVLSVAGAVILQSSMGADYRQVIADDDMGELIRRAEEAIAQNLLVWEAFNAVIFILTAALIYSASAYAYRVLIAKPLPSASAI
jgi:preprotein translocase subunit SecG